MLRLRTLGGLSLSHTDEQRGSIQLSRHRLALLARVAAAGEQGVSRAGLLFQFWPDSDEERGRRALNQIAYSLRRELGQEQLLLGTTDLRLNSAIVTSDVGDFLSAVRSGDHARAVMEYGGAFLADFFLREAAEFERWVEEERARLAAACAHSLDTLASDARAGGDFVSECKWLHRLASMDRLNSRVALRLMEALSAAGDRVGALRFAQAHEAIVRSELDSAPDPTVIAYVARLRQVERAPQLVATAPIPSTPQINAAPPTVPAANAPMDSSRMGSELHPPVTVPHARRRTRRARRALAWGGIAAASGIAIYAFAFRAPRSLHLGEGGHRDWIVVTDVVNATGEPGFDRAVSLALMAGLEQSPQVTVMPMTRIRGALTRMRRGQGDTLLDEVSGTEVARREGARIVVVPAIGRADSNFVVTARIIDAGTGALFATELARSPDRAHLLDAIGDLSAALRRDFGETMRASTSNVIPLPRATTNSLEALEKYADGVSAFHDGHYRESEVLLKSAVALDSDFAMAHVALGQLYYWYDNHRPDGDVHFSRALALLGRLPSGEQMLVRADIAGWRGDRATSIDILRAYLRRYPDDPTALFSLAYNYLRSQQYVAARDAFRRLTLIDSSNYAVWIDLATAERMLHDYRGSLAASARAFSLDTAALTRGNLNNEYGSTFVALGKVDSAELIFRRMLAGAPSQRSDGYQSLSFLDVRAGRYGRAVAHLDSAIVMDRAQRDTAGEARHRLFMAKLEMDEGATAAARSDMSQFMTTFRRTYLDPTLLLWAGRGAARRHDRNTLLELLDTLQHRVRKESTTDQAAIAEVEGEAALLAGHVREARASFALALTLDPTAFEEEAAAHGAFVDGDWVAAERLYRTLADDQACCFEGDALHMEAPYWMGRAAEARGDRAAAEAHYDTLISAWRYGDSTLVILRDARTRRAAIAQEVIAANRKPH